MFNINELAEKFNTKVTQLMAAQASEFDRRGGFSHIARSRDTSRYFPSEFPTPRLAKMLMKPENRDILLEFLRRYHRDEILQQALKSVLKENANDLYSHFAEVPDFLDYAGALANEKNLSEYLTEYDLHSELMPRRVPQKNYPDFVKMAEFLKDYAKNMTNPEVAAIQALDNKKLFNRSELALLIDEIIDTPTKNRPIMQEADLFPALKARYKNYHEPIEKIYHDLLAQLKVQAAYLLNKASYQEALSGTTDQEIIRLLTMFETHFQDFYAPNRTHHHRKTCLSLIEKSMSPDSPSFVLRSLSQLYDETLKAKAFDLPKIIFSANSPSQAWSLVQALIPTNPVMMSCKRAMTNVLIRYQNSIQMFFMEPIPERKSELLHTLFETMSQMDPRPDAEDLFMVRCLVKSYDEQRAAQYNAVLDEVSDNNSPLNNAPSPVFKPN